MIWAGLGADGFSALIAPRGLTQKTPVCKLPEVDIISCRHYVPTHLRRSIWGCSL